MRTLGSSGSESSTPDKTATAASIFTEQSNLVSKCKRFEQKYRMALEQKVCLRLVLSRSFFIVIYQGISYLLSQICKALQGSLLVTFFHKSY